jgi:hypothetical protein
MQIDLSVGGIAPMAVGSQSATGTAKAPLGLLAVRGFLH